MPIRNHFFSPFADIIETQTYPHARTLRTSFSQKLWDCCAVITGSPSLFNGTRYSHVGIFDYLTLGIPLFFYKLSLLAETKFHIRTLFLLAPFLLINSIFFIPRVALGVVVTILFSPIIAVVHGISRLIIKESHEKVLALQGSK